LVLLEQILEQSGLKGVIGPSVVQTEVFVIDDSSPSEGDSNFVLAELRSKPIFDQSEFGTRPGPVPDVGEAGIEPSSVFKETVDDSFDRVVDFEKDQEVDIPIVIVQPKNIETPQAGQGQKKKRIKVPAGRTNLPLVCLFKAMQAEASSSPSQSKSVTPKTTAKSLRKSYRLASQSIQRTLKKADFFEQSPPVEETISSPESSPIRDSGNTPGE